MRHFRVGLISLLLGGVVWGGLVLAQDDEQVSFSKQILPILESNCLSCHGEAQTSTLDLRTRERMLRGGVYGPAVVPGNPEESILYRRVAGLEEPRMPFGGRLDDDSIELLRHWIEQGAKWESADQPSADEKTAAATPQPAPAHAPTIQTLIDRRPITEAERNWWAFQKPVRPAVPQVSDPAWSRNPIDAFLRKKMAEKELEPAPPADKSTLIRRAYLDLVGLLPKPEEVDAFVNDASPNAFARLVDRLLESPHYGERWGRHWLDVARYGDSGGYEHDYAYANAWRYRDYVIRSFNEDKPYDQFIGEQLAGDELDHVTYDTLIATGFNRVGATVGYREKDNPQYRYTYLDDMIATTSRAFMALSVECARCHDHKFDPLLQVDYYRMMAVFFPYVNYDHPLAPLEAVAAYEAKKGEIDSRIKTLQQQIREIEAPYREVAFERRLEQFPEDIRKAVRTPEEKRTPGQQLFAAQVIAVGPGRFQDLVEPGDQEKISRLREQIKTLEKDLPEPLPVATGIRDGDYRFAPDGPGDEVVPGKGNREFYDFEGTFLPQPGEPYVPPPAHFLPTADYQNKGPKIGPGFPLVLTRGDPPKTLPPSNGHITTGRRRALAEWLASEEHPLTARVMVNRIWMHHFGEGIVKTPSNFGRMGQLPTHPDLLDWLAVEFMEQGWSIKQMHRLMMNSEAYRMASGYASKANAAIDPNNDYLWKFRQRRLEGEIIRDLILSASGKLNPAMGGKPFFPPIPDSVRENFPKGDWKMTEEGPEVWRRSVYTYWKRGLLYPFFDVFDLPDLNVSCEQRVTTTVPTQALTLLNNEFVIEQTQYFAERVFKEFRDPAQQVRGAYGMALSREPSAEELERNGTFLGRQRGFHREAGASNPELEALNDLCHVIFNLNEFVYLD